MAKRLALTLGLIAATALWGFTFVAVQDAVSDYSVFSFLALRFALATLALLPFAARRTGRRELRAGLPVGLALGTGMLLQTVGLRTTTSTNSGLITGLYVVFAPLFALALFRGEVSRRVWLAVALSVLGLLLVAGAQPGDLRLGDTLTLLAAVCFGFEIALLSRVSPNSDVMGLTFVQLFVPVALFAPAVFATGAPLLPHRPEVWWAIAITGLGASAFGFWMQTFAQQRIPAGRAAVIMATEPVFAATAGYFLAGDRLVPTQWLGAGLMLLALCVAELSPYIRTRRRSERLARPVAAGAEDR